MFRWLVPWLHRSRSAAARRGAEGERLAAGHVRRVLGYTVLARNWRSPRDRRDELDLVCRDGEALVFIEVKSRAAGALVSGYEAVDARKRRVLRRTAVCYLGLLPRRPRAIRFDVIEVEFPAAGAPPSARPVVRHYPNLPLFAKYQAG
ncbi:MAG: YraN family protein [Verrucomicrobia bacterium]|nr:YraN family protein [Verrucomicrobiota bacterium]